MLLRQQSHGKQYKEGPHYGPAVCGGYREATSMAALMYGPHPRARRVTGPGGYQGTWAQSAGSEL